MFRTEENYRFFLQKFYEYIPPIATLYCYNLLPNHFHTLIRVKSQQVLEELHIQKKGKAIIQYDNKVTSEFIMEQFSNFFNSYTKSFNKVFSRKGKLFIDHLKRNQIADGRHFTKIVHYIHANPVHHGYCISVGDWNYSSYNTIIGNQPTQLPKDEVITWFGGMEAFIKFHEQPINRKFKDRP